jgi:hypothetical protein
MTKRANGEGTFRQLPNGGWEARYYGSDGKRHSISKPTQKEALAALRSALDAAAGEPT